MPKVQARKSSARKVQSRKVNIEPGLSVGFPHRSAEFAEGVEIGILAGLMAVGSPRFDHHISSGAVEQARDLAAPLGYRILVSGEADGLVQIALSRASLRPRLSLVAG